MEPHKILVVEDEQDIRELIHFNLFKEKYEVAIAADGEEALKVAEEFKPNLILLDLMLPLKDGISVCKEVREKSELTDTSIIMLTAKGEEEDVVKGLEAGADDYITKPFSPKILLARIKAALRKSKGSDHNSGSVREIFNLKIDVEKRKVLKDGAELVLTYSEFQILTLLSDSPGKVFTRSQIVDLIRGTNHAITDRSVDVQIVGLRKKLQESGELIETVRGVGYRFKEL